MGKDIIGGVGELCSSIQPILYAQVRNSLEMADVARDYREATGQRYGPNAEVGISQWRTMPLQFSSHLSVEMCSGTIERKHG